MVDKIENLKLEREILIIIIFLMIGFSIFLFLIAGITDILRRL
jgi:hypothetical protein